MSKTATPRLSRPEFIALIAMLFATIAFSIDAMLPALPKIAQDLSPGAANSAQLVVTSFVLGMGFGTFFMGPLSDAFGRKPVILCGSFVYVIASVVAALAQDLQTLLIARVIQGVGASAPRVVSMAMIRDLYSGRQMAQIISLAMLIFTLVPAIAPTIGAGLIAIWTWRAIFIAFVIFAVISMIWLMLRQPESLPPASRRTLKVHELKTGIAQIFTHPMVRTSIMVQALCYGMLFAVLSSAQPVIDVTYGRAATFHLWFALVAVVAGTASIVNALLVMRFGMRRLIGAMLTAQIFITGIALMLITSGVLSANAAFGVFLAWVAAVFFQAGMTLGNLNALALEPMGHIAGMAASVVAGVSTVASVFIAVPIGLAFNGTPEPVMFGVLICAILAFGLTMVLKRLERG